MPKRGRPQFDDQLTPAEWKVAEFVRHGLSNPDIARRQGVSAAAIKYHVANILQKLGMQSRAQLRRWDGVCKTSPLAASPHMTTQQNIGPIGQIARTVSSLSHSEAFYRDVLEIPHLFTVGDLAFFDCGGVRLLLTQSKKPASESILYFRVSDIQHAVKQLTERGADFINAPHMVHRHKDGTEEWMAFFNDPDGRPLALTAQVAAD